MSRKRIKYFYQFNELSTEVICILTDDDKTLYNIDGDYIGQE